MTRKGLERKIILIARKGKARRKDCKKEKGRIIARKGKKRLK